MFNILDKFQSSFNKMSPDEREELKSILSQIEKLKAKSRYDEALDFLRSKLNEFQNTCGLIFVENIRAEIVKVYNEYILSLINKPCPDNKNIQRIKKLFNECDYFIGNNINSYLLKQNNYVCFLNQNGHSKQAMKLQNKLQKIDILNYLNKESEEEEKENNNDKEKTKKEEKSQKKEENDLQIIAKDYSNISSLNNNMKNNYDALISAMESLTLTQFERAFLEEDKKKKENINKNLLPKESEKVPITKTDNKNKEQEKLNNYLLKNLENEKINKSIIHLIITIIIIFFICYFFPILFHIYAIETKNRLNSIMVIYNNFIYIIDRLYDSFYYMIYLCLLSNENYINLPNERDYLINYSKDKLFEIYTESIDLINEIMQNKFILSKNNQEKIDNFNVYFYTNSDDPKISNRSIIHILNLLNEYYFGIYSLLNSKEINFLNVDFNFVLLNSGETFIEHLNDFNEIYMEEYLAKKKKTK